VGISVCILAEGVEVKFRGALYDVLISPSSVPELNNMEVTDQGLVVGGAVVLTELGKKLQELVDSMPGTYGIQGVRCTGSMMYRGSVVYRVQCFSTCNGETGCPKFSPPVVPL
jgi:hypothetical protein